MSDRIEQLVADLTLDEKASLTAGGSLWYVPAVERLGIPALKVSDGPSGVRGDSMIGRARSLSLPCGMAVGSTWDTELVGRLGDALAAEAASKNVHVLLGPTVCIVRTPLAGRTFESFSEDANLSARLAVAYVSGVQRNGVACCIKHFACNDQEHERMTISAVVDEAALHEVHLPAFEAAVLEAGVWSMMTAYNRINGTHACEQPDLVGRVLRDRWGFDGLVMSDWFGTHSTAPAAIAGLDLEMPGPSAWFGPSLAAAVRAGDVDERVVDDKVRHLLGLMERVGILDQGAVSAVEVESDDEGRRLVAREVSTGGMVLLRNDGVLPLDTAALAKKTVAVIGPNARALSMGGGSSEVTPWRRRRVADALAERLPTTEVVYEEGCRTDKALPTIDLRLFEHEGFEVSYFDNADRSGSPVATEMAHNGRMSWVGIPHEALDWSASPNDRSIRIRGVFTADESGVWELGLESAGRATMSLDGQVIVDNTDPQRGTGFYGAGSTVVSTSAELQQGDTHELVVEVWPRSTEWPILGARIAAARPVVDDAFERAVAAASAAEVAVVVVGLNSAWESEGFDRPDLSLPGRQAELVEAVAAANSKTVVVVNAGSPVDTSWAEQVGALVVCWYPGEEGADALADVLVGLSDPGGRLPLSWPHSADDGPTGGSARRYPGVDGEVHYEEGVRVGYRHYATHDVKPQFPFGHGLSYGDVIYEDVRITASAVSVDLTNKGTRPGTEVVQVYVRGDDVPLRLATFAKVHLAPGQTETVELALTPESFRHWDTASHSWQTTPGSYTVMVGSSAEDVPHTGEVLQ
jgi:beta-glucosidase